MTAPLSAGGVPGPKAGSLASGSLGRAKDRAKEVMAGFSSGQKATLAIAVLGIVIGGYLFMSWAAKPSYVPLFSNLSSQDAASMTQKLSTNKIPYRLADNGQQILVPQADVYQQRLDMAASGLPSTGNQGYSLLDSAGVTTSQFQQQIEYQQAVSDELEATIESITGVTSALVNVVIPQQSLFSTGANQPSASVLVNLQPGVTLSAEQVQAIVHLVASSIEGLSPTDVTVVDQNGNVLNAPGTNAGAVAGTTIEQQQTQAYQESLDSSLQNMLATVLGPGNVVVQTNAQLNFDQTQTQSQIYNPNHQPPIPVQQASSKQVYTGPSASQAAGGILGVGATTLPATTTTAVPAKGAKGAKGAKAAVTTTVPATATTVPTYTQTGASQQNVVSQVTKTVNSAPGAIQRLSVAVVVNKSVKGVSGTQIKNLVTAAAGLVPARGDTIQVAFVPFNQSAAKAQAAQLKAQQSASKKATLMNEARDAIIVLVVLALLAFAIRRVTKTTRQPLALPSSYDQLELEAGEAEYGEADPTIALPVPAPALMEPVPASPGLQAEVDQIGQMIEHEPERIAEMLRAWLEASPSDK
ncbi:MAG: flagellar M-ring protein FliF [Actinobacteria bacterium]|nr:flagellar M-ring protein FliF [Actinomycetota bacterium]